MNTADGTYVNGVPVSRQILKSGDQIVLGKTVLEFALKESRDCFETLLSKRTKSRTRQTR